MVFQGSAFDNMTVEENIGPLRMFTQKKIKAEIKERVNFVIDRVNLINANDKTFRNYGMQ
jgi:phospholipid/cholesterol/gamma-HCH transport system ATP-binding protein